MSVADSAMQVLGHCRDCDREVSAWVPASNYVAACYSLRCRVCQDTVAGYVNGHGPRYDGPEWFSRGDV